jgi:hypothetical protein
VRVFLRDLVWKHDPDAYLDRIERFLRLAERHRITVMLVLFDGVWNPYPVAGPQSSQSRISIIPNGFKALAPKS